MRPLTRVLGHGCQFRLNGLYCTLMKQRPQKLKAKWARRIRKLKPQMNALSEAEREQLLSETLQRIYGATSVQTHAGRR